MVSSTLISLLALTPLAFASPTPSTPSTTTQEVEKRGLGYGGIGLGYGGGWGGFGRDRFRKERFRKHKNKALLAKERKHRFNLDKDQALAAKNYKETNFAAEKDRKFDDAKINKAKIAKIAKEKDLRKKLRKGGDFWKRQLEGDGFGLGGGIYDGGYYGGGFGGDFGGSDGGIYDGGIGYFGGGQGQNDGESSLVGSEEGSFLKKRQFGFGDFDGDLYDGGLYDGGLDFFGAGGASPQTASEGVSPEVAAEGDETASPVDGQVEPASSPVNPQYEVSPDVQPTTELSKRQLDDDAAEEEDGELSPDSAGLDDDDSEEMSLEKRSFGHGGFGYGGGLGYGGFGDFGGRRLKKNFRFRNAKLVKLAEVEAARRRKALEHAKVKFNTKKFNELKFKNRLHINEDDKDKAIIAKDRKNVDKVRKEGSDFF